MSASSSSGSTASLPGMLPANVLVEDVELRQLLSTLPALPDIAAFGVQVAPNAKAHRAIKQLHVCLTKLRPGAPLAECVDALEALGSWLCSRRAVPAPPGAEAGEPYTVQRLRLLLHVVREVNGVRPRLAWALRSVFEQGVGAGLFSRLGLPTDGGLIAETIDRISRSFLPEPRDERDLVEFMARLLPSPAELRFVRAIPAALVREFKRELRDSERGINPWAALQEHVLDSIVLLATRISAVGLSEELRSRSPETRLAQSPFFKLPRVVDQLLEAVRDGKDPELSAASLRVTSLAQTCRGLMDECRAVTGAVIENLDRFGVSVDVVYRIELIVRSLDRMEMLLKQVDSESGVQGAERAQELLSELAGLRQRDRKIGDIVGRNMHLLARKIIERAGHTGEHYITSSRGEYFKMLVSAGGGGVLTAGTTAMKYLIGWAHFAPFVEGVLSACNYAGSFIVMQLLGFTLATKQPSMTAAALAGTLRRSAGQADLSALVSMIARIVRSQLAAALGNVGLVIPAAFAFDWVWRMRYAQPFLDEATAQYILKSLHPTQSGTVFYAALTGCLLWMSSIAAGWIENWAVYRRLPEAIEDHRVGRFVGRGTMRFLSRSFQRNIAGFGGNSALGILLGMTPVMGKFFGLPLDVRHVTLSTGALTLSVCVLGVDSLSTPEVQAAGLGIVIIGALNFGVSFVLALAVALRAREVPQADRLRLFLSVAATLVRSPLQFIIPPRISAVDVHGPVSVRPPPPSGTSSH